MPGGPISWSSEGPPPTPYLRTEGLVSARCVNDGPRGYLSIRTNADPRDKRTDRVGGEVGMLGFFLPGWGMHLSDIAEAQGDLIRTVAEVDESSGIGEDTVIEVRAEPRHSQRHRSSRTATVGLLMRL